VLVAGFPAGSFGTNCYVVAPAEREDCVVVDPGQDATDGVRELVAQHGLRPVAVILTHGHVDHIWSVVPVCESYRVPAYIHPDDRGMLSDPGRGFGLPVGREVFPGMTFVEPEDVKTLGDGEVLRMAGLELTVDHAPGHTEGSVTFRLPPGEDHEPILLSGDLLFAGSIGRTDLPGGDYPTILQSLARVCLPLPDETLVLTGPWPDSTREIGRASCRERV